MVEYCYDGKQIKVERDPDKFWRDIDSLKINTVYHKYYHLYGDLLFVYLDEENAAHAKEWFYLYYAKLQNDLENAPVVER